MSFKVRFLLIALFNSALMVALLYFMFRKEWDVSKRLIDLDLSQKQDLNMFLVFLGSLLAALAINLLLLASRKSEVRVEELRRLLASLGITHQIN